MRVLVPRSFATRSLNEGVRLLTSCANTRRGMKLRPGRDVAMTFMGVEERPVRRSDVNRVSGGPVRRATGMLLSVATAWLLDK